MADWAHACLGIKGNNSQKNNLIFGKWMNGSSFDTMRGDVNHLQMFARRLDASVNTTEDRLCETVFIKASIWQSES